MQDIPNTISFKALDTLLWKVRGSLRARPLRQRSAGMLSTRRDTASALMIEPGRGDRGQEDHEGSGSWHDQ